MEPSVTGARRPPTGAWGILVGPQTPGPVLLMVWEEELPFCIFPNIKNECQTKYRNFIFPNLIFIHSTFLIVYT